MAAKMQEVFSEYIRMRSNGLEAKAVLHALRPYIEPLTSSERETLAGQIRTWESGSGDSPTIPMRPIRNATEPNKPIKKLQPQSPPPPSPEGEAPTVHGMPTIKAQETSAKRGDSLGELAGQFDTRVLVDQSQRQSEDYFGPDYVLALKVRGFDQPITLRPQQMGREIVIGRSVAGSAMTPDVDLAKLGGEEQGVSRLHLAMRYDRENDSIHIYDLGSSNGSHINGQRLNPQEVRFLRDGDQLRLGRMVMLVHFMQ